MKAARTARDRRSDGGDASPPCELRLLPAWSQPFAVFLENLSDLLQRRLGSRVETASMPFYDFWHSVELPAPIPWRGLTDSFFMHAALAGLLYALSLWPQPRIHLADAHSFRSIGHYQLSPYLPELHGAPTETRQAGRADPVPARQEIRSAPEAPDNQHQTIITPHDVKLAHDVEMPNLVAYTQPPPAPLDSSSNSAILQLPAPALPEVARRAPQIVQQKPASALPNVHRSQPAPDVSSVSRDSAPKLTELMPPAPNPALPVRALEIVQAKPQPAPSRLQPRPAQPAPDAADLRTNASITELLPPASNPALPGRAPEIVQLKPQPVPSSVRAPDAQGAPEPASVGQAGAPNLSHILAQRGGPALPAQKGNGAHTPDVVALSVHPADSLTAIPEGNRRGAFAASPTGRPNATGAPGADGLSGIGAPDAKGAVNAPPGISVGAPPASASAITTPNAPSANATGNGVGRDPELRKQLLAAVRPPVIASIPQHPPVANQSTARPTELENHVFAGRRSYTLVINMPNLNASVGSWIIRYVDREQGLVAVPITAPEVLRKSDPAFPGELTDVHGVVILTAIIRADGTVSDVAVAQGLFPALDHNAAEALSRWVFRPALKNGQPVDLEAVITVPFRTR